MIMDTREKITDALEILKAVGIGGLPFLPAATSLVEHFLAGVVRGLASEGAQ